jgi:DNA-binding transcriptional LysR family regulator
VARYFAPHLLARYSASHPGVEVNMVEGNRELLLRRLQDNAIDFALMGRPPEELETISEPLAMHPHVIVAPADHPLRDAASFDLQELRQENFLFRERGSGTRMVVEEMFRKHLFTPRSVMELGSIETIKQAVMAGMGVSLLSLHCLPLELRAGKLATLDVIGTPIMRTWYVVQRSTRRLCPAAQFARAFVLEHANAYLERECEGLLERRAAPEA